MRLNRSAMLALCAAALVAGCVPDANSVNDPTGVGFGNYSDYEAARQRREAELRGEALPPRISDEHITTAGATQYSDPLSEISTAENSAEPRIIGDPDNIGISDEQDFGAVSGRETIESDAERIAANRERYEVIQPTAVPQRSGNSGPNIVEFALSTSNAVGESLYRRSTILSGSRFNRNCAKFASSDQAQEAFLKAGGPTRDRTGLDPDGDGFACYWDPTSFRNARQAVPGN